MKTHPEHAAGAAARGGTARSLLAWTLLALVAFVAHPAETRADPPEGKHLRLRRLAIVDQQGRKRLSLEALPTARLLVESESQHGITLWQPDEELGSLSYFDKSGFGICRLVSHRSGSALVMGSGDSRGAVGLGVHRKLGIDLDLSRNQVQFIEIRSSVGGSPQATLRDDQGRVLWQVK